MKALAVSVKTPVKIHAVKSKLHGLLQYIKGQLKRYFKWLSDRKWLYFQDNL